MYDLVYNPRETRLLREAAAAGCETLGGLEMLVAQAQRQFLLWTGRLPDAGVMRAAAERALAGDGGSEAAAVPAGDAVAAAGHDGGKHGAATSGHGPRSSFAGHVADPS